MGRLTDKVAIVTGAGQGIGYAVARRLGEDGATVVAAHRSTESGANVVEAISRSGGKATFVRTDVTKRADVQRLVAHAMDHFGRIDILCNNAAVDLGGSIVDATEEEFDAVMAVNVRGVFLMCKYVVPAMISRKRGSIINIASVAGQIGLPRSAVYSASKGAVMSLTRQLARDYAQDGIRVNVVCPGSIDTPTLQNYLVLKPNFEEALASVEGMNPMHRVGKPTEIAAAVAFAASEEASFMTGATIVVDGGLVIQ